MSSNIIRLYTTAVCLIGGLGCNAAKVPVLNIAPRTITEVPDTLWDESQQEDTVGKSRKNYATEFNALKYVLEKRYRGYDDKFTKRWDDHLFLEFGAGIHKNTGYGNFHVSPLTTAHLGIGKQFSRLHSARLTFGVGSGYFEGNKKNYKQWQASADWLFSLTSFMDGYCPSRLLDVSSVVGFGYRYNNTNQLDGKRGSYDVHVGLQGKLFTGPQGYVTVEPYVGAASRHLYNKFGAFYGVNVGLVYYINNNLSIEDRMRFMKNRPEAVDSTLNLRPQAWRTPWFAELSCGPAFFRGGSEATKAKMGHSTKMSLGRWFSPVVGLRISAALSTVTWDKRDVPMGEQDEDKRAMFNIPVQDNAVRDLHNMTADASVEALINPLGFMKNYSFDQPFNVALALGGGVSWLMKHQEQNLRTLSVFYTAGLHLSYRLSDDLQVFLEPSYSNYNYKIPYRNLDAVKRFDDQLFSVRLGFTAYTRGTHYRQKKADYEAPSIPLSFGVGAGTMLFNTKTAYEGAGFNYTAQAFAEYHFGKVHGVRASFEYMSINSVSARSYRATNEYGTSYTTQGLFNNNYKRGFVALDYLLNVTNLCSGYEGRRLFDAELFLGPALFVSLGNSTSPDGSIKVSSQYKMTYGKPNYYTKPLMGANGGIKLKLNVTNHIGVTLTPQLYVVRYDPQMAGVEMMKLRTFQTLNLGVQYTL